MPYLPMPSGGQVLYPGLMGAYQRMRQAPPDPTSGPDWMTDRAPALPGAPQSLPQASGPPRLPAPVNLRPALPQVSPGEGPGVNVGQLLRTPPAQSALMSAAGGAPAIGLPGLMSMFSGGNPAMGYAGMGMMLPQTTMAMLNGLGMGANALGATGAASALGTASGSIGSVGGAATGPALTTAGSYLGALGGLGGAMLGGLLSSYVFNPIGSYANVRRSESGDLKTFIPGTAEGIMAAQSPEEVQAALQFMNTWLPNKGGVYGHLDPAMTQPLFQQMQTLADNQTQLLHAAAQGVPGAQEELAKRRQMGLTAVQTRLGGFQEGPGTYDQRGWVPNTWWQNVGTRYGTGPGAIPQHHSAIPQEQWLPPLEQAAHQAHLQYLADTSAGSASA